MNIAAYCRVSTDKEEQLESLRHQKEFFTEYARRNGHTLARLYADEGISGTSLKKREAFRQLLRDAETGLFEQVVVKDVSRFARNTVDALQSVRRLRSLGIGTVFINGSMSSIGDGEFALTLFSAMAQEESHNLSKRVKFGKRINARKGRVPPRVFGYDKVDNFTLSINDAEARIVRRIFSLYLDRGLGCRSISMELNRSGDRTKLGGEWDARGVRRILTNPLYCGTLVNHKYEIEDFLTGKQVALPEEERYCHQRPDWAIVTPEIFRRAQDVLAERRKRYGSGEPSRQARYSSRHTFSTLIKCAHCGRSFTRKSYTYVNTRAYWRCVTNEQYTAEKCVNSTILDERELLDALKGYLADRLGDMQTFTDAVLSGLERQLPAEGPEQQQRAMEARRNRLLVKGRRYREMYANDLIDLDTLHEKLDSTEAALRDLELDLQELPRTADPGSCAEEIRQLLSLETVTNVDMRQLIDHISVNQSGEVRVVFPSFGNRQQNLPGLSFQQST